MTLKTNIDGVNRDMTADEEARYLSWQAEKIKIIAEKTKAEENQKNLKQLTLEKLGLTADEVSALLS